MRTPLTRRRLLGGATSGVVAGLSGCGSLASSGDGDDPPTSLPEGGCPGGDTTVADYYDERLLNVDDETYDGDTLCFATLTPYPLFHYDALSPLVAPATLTIGSAGIPFDTIDRASYLKPPGGNWLLYATVESNVDRERYRRRLDYLNSRNRVPLYNERGSYRNYSQYASKLEQAQAIGYGEETFGVAPAAKGPIDTPSWERLHRVLDLADGRERPYHCFYPDVRALLDRLSVTNVVRLWFRRDDDTYGRSSDHAPAGSRAAAFGATLRYADTGEPLGARGIDAPDNVRIETTFRALFPGGGDVDATRRHVEDDRTRVQSDSWHFGEDLAYERDGLVVRVSAERPMTALVD